MYRFSPNLDPFPAGDLFFSCMYIARSVPWEIHYLRHVSHLPSCFLVYSSMLSVTFLPMSIYSVQICSAAQLRAISLLSNSSLTYSVPYKSYHPRNLPVLLLGCSSLSQSCHSAVPPTPSHATRLFLPLTVLPLGCSSLF